MSPYACLLQSSYSNCYIVLNSKTSESLTGPGSTPKPSGALTPVLREEDLSGVWRSANPCNPDTYIRRIIVYVT